MNRLDKLVIFCAHLTNYPFQSYIQDIENEKERTIASNNELAEQNLSKEPELAERREKLHNTSVEGEELTKLVKEKTEELSNLTPNLYHFLKLTTHDFRTKNW